MPHLILAVLNTSNVGFAQWQQLYSSHILASLSCTHFRGQLSKPIQSLSTLTSFADAQICSYIIERKQFAAPIKCKPLSISPSRGSLFDVTLQIVLRSIRNKREIWWTTAVISHTDWMRPPQLMPRTLVKRLYLREMYELRKMFFKDALSLCFRGSTLDVTSAINRTRGVRGSYHRCNMTQIASCRHHHTHTIVGAFVYCGPSAIWLE